jgi:hypothetical protein
MYVCARGHGGEDDDDDIYIAVFFFMSNNNSPVFYKFFKPHLSFITYLLFPLKIDNGQGGSGRMKETIVRTKIKTQLQDSTTS